MTRVPSIAVVDYGMGNRRSVQKALEHVGARALITRAPDELRTSDGLVVPGVGAFPLAMRNLMQLGLAELIRDCVADGLPLLGICLGMQLLFDCSQEIERTEGLGLISGEVKPIQTRELRVPHIGWSEVRFERPSALSIGLPPGGCPFYHVHSLAAHPRDGSDVVATAEYGERFATMVEHERVLGVQFHPEKSSTHGLRMLENFVQLCAARSAAALERAAALRA